MKRIGTLLILLSLLVTSCKKEYNGIDISHHNNVDWDALPDNIEFCYIKATEGSCFTDGMCRKHSANARAKGIKVGFYHYYRTAVPAYKQFENFDKVLSSCPYDLIPVIDVEDIGNDYSELSWEKQNIRFICDMIKNKYGYYPIIYYGELIDNARETQTCVKDLKKWDRTVYNPVSMIENAVITQTAIKTFGKCKIDVDYCEDLSLITVP